jgi:catechol 2,3-dioxygenase-like lactoylglutathione lyase family enzyme
MISYTTIGCSDFEHSKKFFDAALGALGYGLLHDYSEYGSVAWGDLANATLPHNGKLWLMKRPFDGQAASAGNGAMVGLIARTRAQVDAFHTAALANGGSCEGKPGLREAYGPNMYLAYVRDPMGNKFSAMCTAES